MTALSAESGLMVLPSFNLCFLMYTQIFLVTSVRGMTFPPQIAAKAGLRVFGAKMPTPFFFMAATFFLAEATLAALPLVRFSALIAFNVAFVIVVFFVVVVGAAVLVVVVISIEERMKVQARLEP